MVILHEYWAEAKVTIGLSTQHLVSRCPKTESGNEDVTLLVPARLEVWQAEIAN